jgi:hypothetical protein
MAGALHLTEDTRLRFASPKLPSLRYGNFLYPRNVMANSRRPCVHEMKL